MVGFVAAYVAVKFVAAIHASAAARGFNRRSVSTASIGIAPSAHGATLLLRGAL